MKRDMGLIGVLGLAAVPRTAANAPVLKPAAGGPAGKAKTEKLAKAAEQWRQTHVQADQRIASLKEAIRSHYAGGHPELVQAVGQGLAKLDDILGNVDHRLADSLAHAE